MAWLCTLQRCGLARSRVRGSIVLVSLGLVVVAACSEAEERPPFAPAFEGETDIYVAPNLPGGTSQPNAAGGAQNAPDDGSGGASGFGGSGGSAAALGGAGGINLGVDAGTGLIGAGGSALGGTGGIAGAGGSP
jgi:hypothetical protein